MSVVLDTHAAVWYALGSSRLSTPARDAIDERTVADWHRTAGLHCQRVHQHVIEASPMDLKQVQADELRIKAQGQILWMALALCVTTRLWLGGVVSSTRDKTMARAL
jgi:hypothetical protein